MAQDETPQGDRTSEQDGGALPLTGIVVLDFAQFLAGPSAAQRLADLGADVIKIERPDGGDLCRQLYVADQALDGDSTLFHAINRNKRSVAADLKDPADLKAVNALIARADVMIHNFRPGVMERLGLGYNVVSAFNPRLVYGAITGYGTAGPWRDKPGQDLLVQSLSGFAWLSGDADQEPTPTGVSIIDLLTGAHLVQGILAALVRRAVTGRGGRIDVSLMESALDLQFEQLTTYLNSDRTQPERGAISNASVYAAAPYGIYRSADSYLAIAMTPVDRLARLVGCEKLEPYFDKATWFRDRDAIKAILARHVETRTTADWLAILEPAGVWCAEVMTWPTLIAHEGFKALDPIQDVRSASGETLTTTRCPIRVDGRVLAFPRGAPRLGQHTREVLGAFAVESLRAEEAAG